MNAMQRRRLLMLEHAEEEPPALPDEPDAWIEMKTCFDEIEKMVSDGRLNWPADQLTSARSELESMKPKLKGTRPAGGDVYLCVEILKPFSRPFLELLRAAHAAAEPSESEGNDGR